MGQGLFCAEILTILCKHQWAPEPRWNLPTMPATDGIKIASSSTECEMLISHLMAGILPSPRPQLYLQGPRSILRSRRQRLASHRAAIEVITNMASPIRNTNLKRRSGDCETRGRTGKRAPRGEKNENNSWSPKPVPSLPKDLI